MAITITPSKPASPLPSARFHLSAAMQDMMRGMGNLINKGVITVDQTIAITRAVELAQQAIEKVEQVEQVSTRNDTMIAATTGL